jgi:hypothetical protein
MWARVLLPFAVLALSGFIVGWLTSRLTREAAVADARAGEAEALRDQLGRRADVLEAPIVAHGRSRRRSTSTRRSVPSSGSCAVSSTSTASRSCSSKAAVPK